MSMADLIVVAAVVASAAGLVWFFFGTRQTARRAERAGQSQHVTVVVRGRYSPARIEAIAGVPLRITFDRQEGGDCTSRVVFPDLGVTRALPAFTRTTVDVLPDRTGEYGFSCAMNMVHGTLIVTPATNGAQLIAPAAPSASAETPDPAAEEARDAEARRKEVRELTRRVATAALLTTPVLFAAMADSFGAGWMPSLLLNHWWQLALISPVMLVAGAPIHRTG